MGAGVRDADIRVAASTMNARRKAQIILGLLWLLDGALQYQPWMFTKAFVSETLASTAGGNPGLVARPVTWASGVMIHHAAVYNTLWATIQLAIAVGLLLRPTVKVALAASIGWALAVWWFGEGLGGVLSGAVNPFMGAPGAAVLYALIALLVWPAAEGSDDRGKGQSVATSGFLGSTTPKLLTVALWASFVYFMLQPVNRNNTSLGSMISGMVDGEPGWLHSLDHRIGSALIGHGTVAAFTFVALFVFAGCGLFVPRLVSLAVAAGVLAGLAIWVAEDFGGVFTGRGTDPNTGPLICLLATTFWPIETSQLHPGRCPSGSSSPPSLVSPTG